MALATENSTRLFLQEVLEEVREARRKFPRTSHMNTALIEEVGELAQALMECDRGGINKKTGKPFTPEEVVQEAVQVAAMALRVATEGDADFPSYNWPYE